VAIKVVNQGLLAMLDELTAQWGGFLLHLYKNDYTLIAASLLANLTEADFSGYAPQVVGGWTVAALLAGHGSSNATDVVFTNSTGVVGNNIYGYYVTNPASTVLFFGDRDPAAPAPMLLAGQGYIVGVTFTDVSEF
jgi:hypothetical protein